MGYSLILGGARSGKSHFAEERALAISEATSCPVVYVATGIVTDNEMAHRIALHRHDRPNHWKTVEEPVEVAAWLNQQETPSVVVLDCLSMLLNNWMFARPTDETVIATRSLELCVALSAYQHPLIIVSNEVGQGIVPEHRLAREYRDALGRLNQRVARDAADVIWMLAGLPIDVRRLAPQ